jgi:hypothetical protein
MSSKSYLRRYTHLESLRNILCTKSLTLLDFQKWEDKNDSHFLRLYKEERKLKSVLALCLTSASERFHLWHVFGPKRERRSLRGARKSLGCSPYNGSSPLARIGVRIRFDRAQLIEAISKHHGVTCDDIDYITHARLKALAKVRKGTDPISKLPFIKRYGFRDESEFRIIYESKTRSVSTQPIPIPISCIDRIVFSYKLNYRDYRTIRSELRLMDGCQGLDIRRSNLTESKTWQHAAEEVVRAARQKREAHQT